MASAANSRGLGKTVQASKNRCFKIKKIKIRNKE